MTSPRGAGRQAVHHVLARLDAPGGLDAYLAAFPRRRGGFLLDGGRFTLLGAEPVRALRVFRTDRRLPSGALAARVVVDELDLDGNVVAAHHEEVDDPFTALRRELRARAVERAAYAATPIPLLAGAVGYVGYETGQMLERLPAAPRPGSGLPDVALFFHDWVVGRDRHTGETWLSVLGRGDDEDGARGAADRVRRRVEEAFASSRGRGRAAVVPPLGSMRGDVASSLEAARAVPTVSRAAYLAKVRDALGHIEEGDAFEICLTHRLDAPFDGDPLDLFRVLSAASPAPYAALLDLPEGAVVSSSPERFVTLDAARTAESRPIKGTRARGATATEDERLAADLAVSAKDRAENAMIVDLVRNDLGRVCRYGSVVTPDLFAVERHPTVHQLVSTVRGQLDDGKDATDLLRACFPPGSMTGAPKIEAMTILERLEPTERGPYAGGLGWLDDSGTMDLSVVIRAVVVKDGVAHVHVGGAIVADSDPAAEHDETMVKARATLAALAAFATATHGEAASREGAASHEERAEVAP